MTALAEALLAKKIAVYYRKVLCNWEEPELAVLMTLTYARPVIKGNAGTTRRRVRVKEPFTAGPKKRCLINCQTKRLCEHTTVIYVCKRSSQKRLL